VLSVKLDALDTANPGCVLRIRRYWPSDLPTFNPVELLDASIREVDPIAAAAIARRARPGLEARTAEPRSLLAGPLPRTGGDSDRCRG
jgi:glycolate oxidase iron-sulfur subunit